MSALGSQVRSRKQEQCVKNHFRYEWEVEFEYDADTTQCTKARIFMAPRFFFPHALRCLSLSPGLCARELFLFGRFFPSCSPLP